MKKKKKNEMPYPIISTTLWSSESNSMAMEIGSHSLSLAMILTCCRSCLSKVYLKSFRKRERKKVEGEKEKYFF